MELAKSNLSDRREQFRSFLNHAQAGSESGRMVSPEVRRMMISALLVQLYSAVESTMVLILAEIAKSAVAVSPNRFAPGVRREWLRAVAGTHKLLNESNRLDNLEKVVNAIIDGTAVEAFSFEKGGGGNWSSRLILDVCKRLGIELKIPQPLNAELRRPVQDDLDLLEFLMKKRNNLSHGNLTFSEGAGELTCEEVDKMGSTAFEYLALVISSSETFLATSAFT